MFVLELIRCRIGRPEGLCCPSHSDLPDSRISIGGSDGVIHLKGNHHSLSGCCRQQIEVLRNSQRRQLFCGGMLLHRHPGIRRFVLQCAGIGAAFIILWVAPATNILAIVYTGAILGTEMVILRILSALAMAF